MSNPLSSEAERRIKAALTELRCVFRDARGSSDWGDMQDSSVTLRKNVWDLSDADFENYGWHSVCINPSSDLQLALRYFLPRAASNLAWGKWSSMVWDTDHLAKLLRQTNWLQWPAAERSAIRQWMLAWIELSASGFYQWYNPDATKLAAMSGCDLASFYAELHSRDPLICANWIAHEVEVYWQELLSTGWPGRWDESWGESISAEVAKGFLRILLSPSTLELLDQEFLRPENTPQKVQLVAEAIEHIHMCRDCAHLHPNAPLGKVGAAMSRE